MRHPATGHLIDNEEDWRDAAGNWYPTEKTEHKDGDGKVVSVKYKPLPPKKEADESEGGI